MQVKIPSIYSNMCGWFTDIKSNFFGSVGGSKIWVVLCHGEIFCYDSPYEGTLVRRFLCKEITDITESMCDKLEIKFETITIKLLRCGDPPVEDLLTWGWSGDSTKIKGKLLHWFIFPFFLN